MTSLKDSIANLVWQDVSPEVAEALINDLHALVLRAIQEDRERREKEAIPTLPPTEKEMEQAGMSIDSLRRYSFDLVRSTIRIVKPWKKRVESAFKDSRAYAEGWNDCIKEMSINSKALMKRMEDIANDFSPQPPHTNQ